MQLLNFNNLLFNFETDIPTFDNFIYFTIMYLFMMSKMMADLNNFSFALYLFQKDYIAAVYFLIYSVLSEYKTKDFLEI